MENYMADVHIHSKYSWDSKNEIKDIIESLKDKKLKYIAITDHVEFSRQPIGEVINRIKYRNQEIDKLQDTTDIKIIKGLEISEPHLYETEFKILQDIKDIEYIIGSIHNIYRMPLRKMVDLKKAYNIYYESMLKMVENATIDTLAHMDYIKRFIKTDSFNDDIIKEILKCIIKKNIALEINTSGVRRNVDNFPSNDILDEYIKLGGTKVVLGSDAHRIDELYDNIPNTIKTLNKNLTPGIIINHQFRNL